MRVARELTARLETPRLLLRPFTLDDAPAVQQLVSDARVAATTASIPHPYPEGAAEQWIASHGGSRNFHFAVVARDTQTLVGAITLVVNHEHRSGDTGYWVGVPYWNRGYATEALRAVLAFGFGELGLERIQAEHFGGNRASGRVLEKAGMRYEGCSRRAFLKGGTRHDVHLYGALRDEWSA